MNIYKIVVESNLYFLNEGGDTDRLRVNPYAFGMIGQESYFYKTLNHALKNIGSYSRGFVSGGSAFMDGTKYKITDKVLLKEYSTPKEEKQEDESDVRRNGSIGQISGYNYYEPRLRPVSVATSPSRNYAMSDELLDVPEWNFQQAVNMVSDLMSDNTISTTTISPALTATQIALEERNRVADERAREEYSRTMRSYIERFNRGLM